MKKGNDNRGFTFIELLIALSIIFLVGSMGVLTTRHVRNRAMLARFKGDIRVIKQAAIRYEGDCGFFPPDVYRGVDPGLREEYGWKKGSHSVVWESIKCDVWRGPYIRGWPRNPWGGLYDWDNYPSNYTAWGIPGGGVYLTLKPSTWGGKDGLPPRDFEELAESLGIDRSRDDYVIAVWMGREPTWSVPGQP